MKRIILVLLIIGIFLVGCDNKKADVKEDNYEKEEIVETNITDEINQKIDRFIKALQLKYVNISNKELSENEKLYYAFYIASNELHANYVLKDDINKTMIELFGENVEYKDRDIQSLFTNETIAYFKDDKYVYNHDTAHGVMMVKGYSYEVSRERKNDIIKVEIKRVYINCGDTCPVDAVYKDPEYKEKYDVPEKYCIYDKYMPDFCDIKADDFLKENLDAIPKLTFEFKLEGDNPVFSKLYK